jgi:type III pantothenate kinase
MILAIDAGNSRVKWGLHGGGQWLKTGMVPNSEAVDLRRVWQALDPPAEIVISNVAGSGMARVIADALRCWPVAPRWVVATAEQCGVRNGYDDPACLGSDRWAALIAARHLCPEGCLVVNAGTALTVDALSGAGVFLGGIIVPGLACMKSALAASTASVRVEHGRFRDFPACTADAVHSGALMAAVGAVDQMAARLERAEGRTASCVLSGGDGERLRPLLRRETKLVENLVLEGLIRIALA